MMENGVSQSPRGESHGLTPLRVQSITEFGSHDDLLKKGGSYATLYEASV